MTAKPQVRRKSAHVAPRREFSHIRDLTPDPANRRKRTPRNVGMIVDALQKVGASRSIVIDEAGEVLAGNGVLEAAAEAGITKVRVVDADGSTIIAVRRSGLTAKQKRDLAIYDNRAAELAEWDTAQLAADLEAGEDLSAFFFEDELKALLAKNATVVEGLTDPDEVPELRTTDIARGDLFQLGKHRLLCGDCTVQADVKRLMGDQKAALVFTDPPYGVAYQGGRNPVSNTPRKKLAGDDTADLYLPALLTTRDFCASDAALYLWFSGTHGAEAYAAVTATGYTVRALLVWNKLDAHYGNFMAQYMNKHEPFLYCVLDSPPSWLGPTNEVTVWDVKQPARNEFHPTQKPVELALRAIQNSLGVGGIVADWFLGSGSTLIAAEQSGRSCVGIELDPSYCQVIIDRWEAFTGRTAIKVGELVTA